MQFNVMWMFLGENKDYYLIESVNPKTISAFLFPF